MGSRFRRISTGVLTALILAAVLAAAAFAFMHRQEIIDHLDAQKFEPSAEIVTITDRLELTDAGHRVFWASQPTVEASQTFNEQCSRVDHSEEGYVLGCFVNGSIHLFAVTDDRLNGIVEVTAAHELLHAAFGRLSDSEREALSQRLSALYEELILDNPELEERMAVYSGLSTVAFANELHSVLGTEVAELPQWLEEHFAQWLENRDTILEYFHGYHAVFDSLKERAEVLQQEMAILRADVEERSATYDTEVERFNADWEEFLRRNDAFEFSADPDEFYRLRDDFYARRDALGAEMNRLNDDIARYEQMRTELMQLSELNHELEQQLDSELAPPAPAPTQEV